MRKQTRRFHAARLACMLPLAVRRRWVGAIGLGAAAAATTSVFACQQLVGIPGDPPVPTAVSACGLPYGNNACAACVATSCCTESTACAGDPVCSAYEECLGKSNGDWQARSQCVLDHPASGSAEVSPLSACLASKCTSECGLTCGGLAANYTAPDHAASCQACVAGSSFCAPEQACAASEACDALVRCRLACENGDCLGGCLNTYDAGIDLFTSFTGTVFEGTCSAPCAFGNDWSCVGRVSWAGIKSATTTFTIDVEDYETMQPISGVDVSVCEGLDQACDAPLAERQTDPMGMVVMQVPNQAQVGGLGLNGYLQFTSSSTLPELFYWGFPLSENALAYTGAIGGSPPLRLVTPSEAHNLAESLGMPLDPNLGLLSVYPVDCLGHLAPDVQITTNVTGLRAVYDLSSTAPSTDSTGLVTFANAQVGRVDLTAVPVQLGKASSHITVFVRAGFETSVIMFPTP